MKAITLNFCSLCIKLSRVSSILAYDTRCVPQQITLYQSIAEYTEQRISDMAATATAIKFAVKCTVITLPL